MDEWMEGKLVITCLTWLKPGVADSVVLSSSCWILLSGPRPFTGLDFSHKNSNSRQKASIRASYTSCLTFIPAVYHHKWKSLMWLVLNINEAHDIMYSIFSVGYCSFNLEYFILSLFLLVLIINLLHTYHITVNRHNTVILMFPQNIFIMLTNDFSPNIKLIRFS